MRTLTAIGVRCAVLAAVLAVITTLIARPVLAVSGLDTAASVTSMPFSISGATIMTLTGTGLGIGIVAPNVPLDLGSGVSEKVALYDNGAGNRYGFGISGGELDVFGGTLGNINFKTNGYSGTSLLYLATGGFIGVGTTNPGYTLDVNGNVNVRSDLTVAGNAHITGTETAAELFRQRRGTEELIDPNIGDQRQRDSQQHDVFAWRRHLGNRLWQRGWRRGKRARRQQYASPVQQCRGIGRGSELRFQQRNRLCRHRDDVALDRASGQRHGHCERD